MTKLVLLTDTHIVREGERSHGVDTASHLTRAIDEIARHHADAAACLFLGDLTENGDPAAFARFRDLTAALPMPVHLMMGNHDDRDAFRLAFPEAPVDDHGFVQFEARHGDLRLIALDSVTSLYDPGWLCETRLEWLAVRLSQHWHGPTVLTLHHHLHPLDMDVDRVPLSNPGDLAQVVAGSAAPVSMILSGHVHRRSFGAWQGIPRATLTGLCWTTRYHQRARGERPTRSTHPIEYHVLRDEDGDLLLHSVQVENGAPRDVH